MKVQRVYPAFSILLSEVKDFLGVQDAEVFADLEYDARTQKISYKVDRTQVDKDHKNNFFVFAVERVITLEHLLNLLISNDLVPAAWEKVTDNLPKMCKSVYTVTYTEEEESKTKKPVKKIIFVFSYKPKTFNKLFLDFNISLDY